MKALYEMSDEELLSLSPEELAAAGSADDSAADQGDEGGAEGSDAGDAGDASTETQVADGSDEQEEDAAAAGQAADDDGEGADDGQEEQEEQTSEDKFDDAGDDVDDAVGTPPVAGGTVAKVVTKSAAETPASDSVDYKSMYERIIGQPIRANGKEIVLESIDDAISLIQMGANYNKKMAGLKPNLRLLKMLENNGLLSEEKLSFLIDLEKKNPEEIAKLVKDSGVDPLEIDQEKGEYKPGTYTVADRELELDAVLDKIQDTPTFSKTIDIVGNKWDGPSKQAIAQSPELLEVINDHMQSGIFDLISTRVERERLLGRLNGLSDLAAYNQVGDALHKSGGFDQLAQKGQQSEQPAPRREVQRKPKEADPARDNKRRAASPTRAETPTKPAADFNPLAMSDAEFAKIDPRLM